MPTAMKLNKGKDVLGDKDDKLKTNLLNLQNGKKMVMKGYEVWYQFQLEMPPIMPNKEAATLT